MKTIRKVKDASAHAAMLAKAADRAAEAAAKAEAKAEAAEAKAADLAAEAPRTRGQSDETREAKYAAEMRAEQKRLRVGTFTDPETKRFAANVPAMATLYHWDANPCDPSSRSTDANGHRKSPGRWRAELFACAEKAPLAGLGGRVRNVAGKKVRRSLKRKDISRSEAARMKTKLVGAKEPTYAPDIDNIDPWSWEVDPCDGMSYNAFKSGFTRKNAYWNRAAGRAHGPTKRQTNTEHARLKRMMWQEKLHHCAMRVYLSRAKVSKNELVRRDWKKYRGEWDATDFDPAMFDGLGKAKKSKKRKKTWR